MTFRVTSVPGGTKAWQDLQVLELAREQQAPWGVEVPGVIWLLRNKDTSGHIVTPGHTAVQVPQPPEFIRTLKVI